MFIFSMIFARGRQICKIVKIAFLSERNLHISVPGKSMLAPSWSQGGPCWPMLGPVGPKLAPTWPELV